MSVFERPLTVNERLLHAVAAYHAGDGMPIFAARCSGPWNAESFRIALNAVQARHPLLRSRIIEPQRGWPRFQLDSAAPPIPLDVHDAQSETAWEQTALRHSDWEFDASQAPLCRFTVLPDPSLDGFDIVASFHHSIVDALSMLALLRELFDHMSGRTDDLHVCAEEYSSRVMRRTSRWQHWRTIGQLIRKGVSKRFWPSANLSRQAPSPGHCIRLVWPEDLTRTLVLRSRREQTTVFGALAAGALQTLAAREQWSRDNVQLQVPIDIRDMYSPAVDRNTLGCYASILGYSHFDPLSHPFWDLARQCRREVQHDLNCEIPNCTDHVLKRVAFTLRRLKRPRQATVSVNNLGRCDVVSAGPWRLEEFSWFGRSQSVGANVSWNAATINGCLNLTLQGARVSRAALLDLAERMTDRLTGEIEPPAFLRVATAV